MGETIYAEKIAPEEHHLDWSARAGDLIRVVRLGEAWTTFRDKRLKIWRRGWPRPRRTRRPGRWPPGQIDGLHVGTGDGLLELVEVQPEGKGRQPADAWATAPVRPRPIGSGSGRRERCPR